MHKTLKDLIAEYEDTINPIIQHWQQLELFPTDTLTRQNTNISRVDNGYILDYTKILGNTCIRARRVYKTEGEVEAGVAELNIQFDNLLREKQAKGKD